MDKIFIGRQPIYHRDKRVVGYELLYRAGLQNRAEFTDGEQATTELLISSHMDFGLEALVGDRLAFINLSRGFLTGEQPLPFTRKQLVLEVLEDTVFDPPLLAGLRQLAQQGYTLALDDFEFHADAAAALELAHIVKLDVLTQNEQALERQVARLRPFGVKLLAEKVETPVMFAHCLELGFDYFQGYFFCKPELIEGQRRASNHGVVLSLLAALHDPEATAEELEALIAQDAPLTLRLLRYINSAAIGFGRKIDSIRQALLLAGTRNLRSWASLVLLAQVKGKPSELTRTALVRARMCELLASAQGRTQQDSDFTVGLLSVVDALLDRPMDELLQQLPLGEEVKAALLTRSGPLGDTLSQVLDYERGRWSQLEYRELAPSAYTHCYLEAIQWADASMQVLGSPS